MTECYECSRLAELTAENSQLREKVDELTDGGGDYVSREAYEDLRDEFVWVNTFLHRVGKQCGTKDVPSLKAYVEQLEAKMDAQRDSNGTCPDAMGQASNENATCNKSGVFVTDSREKLEADCEKLIGRIQKRTFSGRDAGALRFQLRELLDRQAAITEREHPGLTVSDDESLINWHGRNYLLQSRVLNAERERDEFSLKLKHEMELNLNNRNAHDLERIAELQARVDELERENARLSDDEFYLRCTLVDINGEVIS